MADNHDYVVITPARNAERHIEHVLQSMCTQTSPPLRWVVVNDGSTDGTSEILKRWSAKCPFMEIVDITPLETRNFASKVNAFNKGLDHVRDLPYKYLANLDADMTLESSYYANLVAEFQKNPRLGICSGIYLDQQSDGQLAGVPTPTDYCPGALQMFRRECYEEIGGYPALRVGGIDTAAVMFAKMKGWQVRSFHQYKAIHHGRKELSFTQVLSTRRREGARDHGLGMHPAYALAKSLSRCASESPPILGSFMRLAGYISAWIRHEERQIPGPLIDFVQREEIGRLRSAICQPLGFRRN